MAFDLRTDRQKLKDLLDEWDVEYSEKDGEVWCEEGKRGVGGYCAFLTAFDFNEDGKFLKMGAYER